MDKELMAKALQTVLGEGYEARSHTTARATSKSPSPHDALQDRVSKSNPSGGDMHVPTTIGASGPKKKGKLKAVEYVGKAKSAKQLETQSKVSQGLLTAGATGGLLSLPSLVAHTRNKLGEAKKGPNGTLRMVEGTGRLKALKSPKVAAGLAITAAGLETAGLAGDFLGHHTIKEQRKAGVAKADDDLITFSKVDDEKKQVFGWCSISKKDGVDVVDLQGDFIPIEEIEKSAYNYMLTSRKGGNQHARVTRNFGQSEIAKGDEPLHIGDCIESMVFTPEKIEKMGLPDDFPQGWWFGMQIHDEQSWQDVKSGKRAGFSVHGKGRREELVAKEFSQKAGPGQIGYEARTRKERVQSFALGTAGATAAGSGLGAALVPLAHKKGKIGTLKATHLKGRLASVGAIVGGSAGVYSGIHSAHAAAKPAVIATRDKVGSKIKTKVTKRDSAWHAAQIAELPGPSSAEKPTRSHGRSWSPTVDHRTAEQRRARRAKGYQVGAGVGSVAALGGAAHQADKSRKAYNAMVGAGTMKRAQRAGEVNLQSKYGQIKQDVVDAHDKRVGAKVNNRGLPQMNAAHKKALKGVDRKAVGSRKQMLVRVEGQAKSFNRRKVASGALHTGRAGKLGLASAGLALAAGAIGHQRKGSWRPYPGVQ